MVERSAAKQGRRVGSAGRVAAGRRWSWARGVLGASWIVVALAVGGGCGPAPDERSGEDAMRGGAVEIPLDQPVDDRVSASQGDSTDWKVFELPQPAKVTVKVWWDNPRARVGLRLRGMGGGQARALRHAQGVRHEQLGPIELPAGKWFLQIEARSGATVYTLEVVTGASSAGGDLPDF